MKFNDCFFSASPHRMTGVGHMTRKVLREHLMSREETHTDRDCVSTYSMYKLLHTDMADG